MLKSFMPEYTSGLFPTVAAAYLLISYATPQVLFEEQRLEALRLTFHVEGKFWQAQNFLKKLQCDNKENQLVV